MRHEVLHILGTGRPEGASIAREVGMLAGEIDPQRYRLHACFLDGDGPIAQELRQLGMNVLVFEWTRGMRDCVGAWQFYHTLRSLQFSIIHQHFGGRQVGYLARLGSRGSLIFHLWARPRRSDGTLISNLRPPRADALLAPSKATAGLMAEAGVRVVYPGLQVTHYRRACGQNHPRADGHVIGTAARLVPIKGVINPIRAMAALVAEFPDLRLEIAGSGPEQPLLEKEAERIGVRDRVEFLGWQGDLRQLMAKWDVFVLPSLEEPLPIVGLEAMALSLPVVSSAVDGMPELVEEGRTGLLVPPADPDALADRLRTLLLDADLRCAMGKAGCERVREHFSAEKMAGAITRIYDEVLNARASEGLSH